MSMNDKTQSPILALQQQRLLLDMEYTADKETFRKQTEEMGLMRLVKRGDAWCPLRVGRSYSLDPEILPHTATNKEVSYTSSRPQIVSVSEYGTLKGLKTGTSIITIEAKDGSGKSCKLRVSVVEKKGKFDTEISELADRLNEVETAYEFLDFYDYLVMDTEEKEYELKEKEFLQYTKELVDWIDSWGEDFIEMEDEEWELLAEIVFNWVDDEWGLLEEWLAEFEEYEW